MQLRWLVVGLAAVCAQRASAGGAPLRKTPALLRPFTAAGEAVNQTARTLQRIATDPASALSPMTWVDPFVRTAKAGLTGSIGTLGYRVGREDPIPATVAWARKARSFGDFLAQSRREHGPLDQAGFVGRSRALVVSSRVGDLSSVLGALFSIEGLARGLYSGGGTLADRRIDPGVLPIAHIGLGMAFVDDTGFRADRILAALDRHADPRYRDFSLEGVGFRLAAAEPGLMSDGTALMHQLGLGEVKPVSFPADPGALISALPPGAGRLISSGFGRALYFKSSDVMEAIEGAKARSFLDLHAAVRGIAWAYANVNAADLPSVIRAVDAIEPGLRADFAAGIEYAVEFADWARPGALTAARRAISHPLLEHANRELEELRASRGNFPPPG